MRAAAANKVRLLIDSGYGKFCPRARVPNSLSLELDARRAFDTGEFAFSFDPYNRSINATALNYAV